MLGFSRSGRNSSSSIVNIFVSERNFNDRIFTIVMPAFAGEVVMNANVF